jgi:hypothetical protein
MRTQHVHIEIECSLDQEYFLDWESLSPEAKAFWTKAQQDSKQSNCEGQGGMGWWCQGCPFCNRFNADL